jgi:hypothetical protein
VGVAVEVPDQRIRPGPAPRDALWRFRVDGVYKGAIPADVSVEAPVHGASCGLELTKGDRVGLFVERDGRRLRSNLCWKVGAGDMQLTGVRPSAPVLVSAAQAPAEGANAFPVEALWTFAAAMLLLTVALMMARQRAES